MPRIAIIGGGSMGEALLAGLLRAGRQVKDMVVAESMPEKVCQLSDAYSVRVTSDVADAVETADIVVIAVKPADVGQVITDIAGVIVAAPDDSPEKALVTIAAGVTTGYIESKLPAGTSVFRVMPNTAVRVGAGASVLAEGRYTHPEQREEVTALFDAVGSVVRVPEEQLDAATAVSGSGPAYFFLLVEALVDAAVGAGLNRQVASELAARTMAGAAAMLSERLDQAQQAGAGVQSGAVMDTTPAQLRAAVTSPGGTTAAALRELERAGLRAAVDQAVRAAKTHAEQLKITSE